MPLGGCEASAGGECEADAACADSRGGLERAPRGNPQKFPPRGSAAAAGANFRRGREVIDAAVTAPRNPAFEAPAGAPSRLPAIALHASEPRAPRWAARRTSTASSSARTPPRSLFCSIFCPAGPQPTLAELRRVRSLSQLLSHPPSLPPSPLLCALASLGNRLASPGVGAGVVTVFRVGEKIESRAEGGDGAGERRSAGDDRGRGCSSALPSGDSRAGSASGPRRAAGSKSTGPLRPSSARRWPPPWRGWRPARSSQRPRCRPFRPSRWRGCRQTWRPRRRGS